MSRWSWQRWSTRCRCCRCCPTWQCRRTVSSWWVLRPPPGGLSQAFTPPAPPRPPARIAYPPGLRAACPVPPCWRGAAQLCCAVLPRSGTSAMPADLAACMAPCPNPAHPLGGVPPLPPPQVRGNSSLCAAPMLSHPLTAQRIKGVHSAMRLLAAFLPGEGRERCTWRGVLRHACGACLLSFSWLLGVGEEACLPALAGGVPGHPAPAQRALPR